MPASVVKVNLFSKVAESSESKMHWSKTSGVQTEEKVFWLS